MSRITTKDGTQIYYKDWGTGQPIVFHHGWPLSSDDWDAQLMFFLSNGYRVIAHDRRGHGRSTQTANGNDMDTYAADVAQLAPEWQRQTDALAILRPQDYQELEALGAPMRVIYTAPSFIAVIRR